MERREGIAEGAISRNIRIKLSKDFKIIHALERHLTEDHPTISCIFRIMELLT